MKSEKLYGVLDYTIEVVGEFIGYENSPTIDRSIAHCLKLISSALDLTNEQYLECLTTLKDLFSVNKYFDYVLRKENNGVYLNDFYENTLKKLNNRTIVFKSHQFKNHLNDLCIQNNLRAIRLKAFLFESGDIYSKDSSLSLTMFKKCGYTFDTNALLILSKLDEKNCKKYIEIYDVILKSFDSDGIIDTKDFRIEKIVMFYKNAYSKRDFNFKEVEKFINNEASSRKVGFVL